MKGDIMSFQELTKNGFYELDKKAEFNAKPMKAVCNIFVKDTLHKFKPVVIALNYENQVLSDVYKEVDKYLSSRSKPNTVKNLELEVDPHNPHILLMCFHFNKGNNFAEVVNGIVTAYTEVKFTPYKWKPVKKSMFAGVDNRGNRPLNLEDDIKQGENAVLSAIATLNNTVHDVGNKLYMLYHDKHIPKTIDNEGRPTHIHINAVLQWLDVMGKEALKKQDNSFQQGILHVVNDIVCNLKEYRDGKITIDERELPNFY